MDDNADAIFEHSRAKDAKAEQDEIVESELDRRLREADARAAAEKAANPEPAPVEEAPAEPEGEGKGYVRDVAESVARGPGAGLADMADNGLQLTNQLAKSLGFPGLAVFPKPEEAGLRKSFDESFGTPETLPGEFAQVASEQLAYILPAFKAIQGVGAVANFIKLGAVSATVAGATQNSTEGNASSALAQIPDDSMFSFANNKVTQFLAIDEDDSVTERFAKAAAEDVLFGIAGEAAIGTAKLAKRLISVKKVKPGLEGIESAAARSGVETDAALRKEAETLVAARTKVEMAQAALDNIKAGRKAAADTRALSDATEAYKGGIPAKSTEAEALVEAQVEAIAAKTQTMLDEGTRELDTALLNIKKLAEGTETDGRVLEAIRQELGDFLDADGNLALGAAATRNMPDVPLPPKKTLVGNYLEANEETSSMIAKLANDGDFEGMAQVMGQVYDSTNYEKFASGDEGVAELIRANAAVLGNSKFSTRPEVGQKLARTELEAQQLMAKHIEENGGNIEKVVAAQMEMLPDLTDFRVVFNALRMTEMGLAEKVKGLLENAGTAKWSDWDRAEFIRWSVLLSNVTDRRAGLISEIGGTLSANRLSPDSAGFNDVLAFGRQARNQEVEDVIRNMGGKANIDQLAELAMASMDADTIAKTINQNMDSFTVGDLLYNSFVMNILSSGRTQAVNVGTNSWVGAVWNPVNRFAEASVVSLIKANPQHFKVWTAHLEGMKHGLKGAFALNGSFSQGRIAQAFRQGQRVTGGKEVKFGEVAGRESLLRAKSLGSLVRRGMPVHTPFSGMRKAGGSQARLFGFVPASARNGIVDFAEKRFGPAARVVDFVGRVMDWPGKMLAAGDELAASLNYHAQLAADTVEEGIQRGLSGAELTEEVMRMRAQVGNLATIRKNADMLDPVAMETLERLERLNTSASQYAQRGTFTEPAGDAVNGFLLMREAMPALRWFAPFVKTPANLFVAGLRDFTPLGAAADSLDAIGKGDVTRLAKAQGRLAVTGAVWAGVWDAAQNGTLTGGGPHNPDQRAVWLAAGNKPYSIKIGDEYYSYSRFDPIAMPIAMLADLMYLQGRSDGELTDELMGEALGVFMEAMKSKVFLQGMSDMMHMFEDPTRYIPRFAVSTVQNTIVPGSRFWASLEQGGLPVPPDLVAEEGDDSEPLKLFKDVVRGRPAKTVKQEGEGFFIQLGSSIQADLPAGMSEGFGAVWEKIVGEEFQRSQVADRDFFYQVINAPPGLGPDFVSPFVVEDVAAPNPVGDQLADMGFGFSPRKRFGKIGGVQLNPQQRDKFHKLFAEPKNQPTMKTLLTNLMFDEDGNERDGWKVLNDNGRKQLVTKIIGGHMRAAKAKLLADDPELRGLVEADEAQRKAITKEQDEANNAADPFRGALR